jgi:predicted DNA-binding transcriptional regulator YafY
MSINKAAKYRYEIIDQCLRMTTRRWTRKALQEKINRRLENKEGEGTSISRSQVHYDLEAMIYHFDAPIEKHTIGRESVYYYSVEGYSIKNIPVSEQELDLMADASVMLKQKKGLSVGIGLGEITRRLQNRYEDEDIARPAISFQKAPAVEGLQYLDDIYRYIKKKTVITISYQAFRSDRIKEYTLHPYLLKEDDHRWYVLAYAEEAQQLRVFALDRMRSVKPLDLPYKESELEDNEDYFRNVIGVTVLPGEQVEDIQVIFSPKMAPYICSRKLHHSQEVVNRLADGSIHVRYQLMINPELVSRLFSYDKDVRVLRPQRLIEAIKESAEEMISHYH